MPSQGSAKLLSPETRLPAFQGPTLTSALKRGALLSAANPQVVAVQFLAESLFKLLLAVPIVCGAIFVVLLAGGDLFDLIGEDLRDTLAVVASALAAHPAALVAFVVALFVVLIGGSVLMFLIKGGTITVLVDADRVSGPIEQFPVTLGTLRRAAVFSLQRFTHGCSRLYRRYLMLGFGLMAIYVVSGLAYLAAVVVGFSVIREGAPWLERTAVAAIASFALACWITVVNLVYLLIQTVAAADDVGLRVAIVRVLRFLRVASRDVTRVLMVMLVLVALALAASLLATAALGLIAFVPLFWLAALPLQAVAWLVRGVVFQFLGLAALGAYLNLYRSSPAARGSEDDGLSSTRHSGPAE